MYEIRKCKLNQSNVNHDRFEEMFIEGGMLFGCDFDENFIWLIGKVFEQCKDDMKASFRVS